MIQISQKIILPINIAIAGMNETAHNKISPSTIKA
jgi:hypothetical protein